MRLFIGSWRHTKLGTEITCKSVGTGESAGHTNLLDSKLGLIVHQAYGMVETQLADVGRQRCIVATLRKGCTDAILRESGTFDKRLTAEIGLQEQLLVLYQVAQEEE